MLLNVHRALHRANVPIVGPLEGGGDDGPLVARGYAARQGRIRMLDDFRYRGEFCDIVLVAREHEFPAHRAVLATAGGLLHELARNAENVYGVRVVLDDSIDTEAIRLILQLIYRGEFQVNLKTAVTVLEAASFLRLDSPMNLTEICLDRIIQGTNTELIPIYNDVYRLNCKDPVKTTILKQIAKNFEVVTVQEHGDFLEHLSPESLQYIVSLNKLEVHSEEVVFGAIVDWVKHKEERRDSFYNLFKAVRLFSLDENFIKNTILVEELVASNPACIELVNSYLLEQTYHHPTQPNTRIQRSSLDKYTDCIMFFPKSENAKNLMQYPLCVLPSSLDEFYTIPLKETGRKTKDFYGFPVYYNGFVYLLRSIDKAKEIVIDSYEIEKNKWLPNVAVLEQVQISLYGVAILQGKVYIVGGNMLSGDGKQVLAIPDVYYCDLAVPDKVFKNGTPLNKARCRPYVVADDKCLYAIGGCIYDQEQEEDDKKDRYRDVASTEPSVERYNPQTKTWETLAPLPPTALYNHGSCTIDVCRGQIFVISAKLKGHTPSCSAVYNIATNTWSEMSKPGFPPVHGTLSYCNDVLYLIRQFEEKIATQSYSLDENRWYAHQFISAQEYSRPAEDEEHDDADDDDADDDKDDDPVLQVFASRRFFDISSAVLRLPRPLACSLKAVKGQRRVDEHTGRYAN